MPSSEPLSIRAFQQLIRTRYYETDVQRGASGTFMLFIEEVGELATALHDNREGAKPSPKHKANLAEEFADVLPDRAVELAHWLVDNGIELLDRLSERPYTMLHGDFRPDNLFFGDGKTDFPLAVIDWQAVGRGAGLYDVAYFLGYSINEEDHGAIDGLIESYHTALVEAGVSGYDLDRCKRDHALGQLMVLHRGIFLVAQLDLSHERGRALVDATLKRTLGNLPMADLDTVFD